MKGYFYKFSDGYFCWFAGKLKGLERKIEIKNHGAIIEERAC